jgi:hypothetical protein
VTTTADAGLMPLVLELGRARASTMDVTAALDAVCSAVTQALEIGGAALLLVEPPCDTRELTTSDEHAAWIAEMQQRADMGPLPGALRTWRTMLTADLTRIGPPALAAAAAECGLVSSLVLPFGVEEERTGVLQLLADAYRPVGPADGHVVQPLLDVLAARLSDVRVLRRSSNAHTPLVVPSPVPHAPSPRPAPERPRSPAQAHAAASVETTAPFLPAVGLEAAVQDSDQAVGELAQGGPVAQTAVALLVVVGPRAG